MRDRFFRAPWPDAIALLACLAFFWRVYWPLRSLAGFSSEDWNFAARSAQTLRWLRDAALMRPPSVGLPLSWSWGHGPWTIYLTAPFIALFGLTPTALRLCNGFYASAAIVTAYALARSIYGSRLTALLAAGLLAASPALMLCALTGGISSLREIPFALAAFAFLLAFMRSKTAARFLGGCAVMGVAFSCHLAMAAWLAAAAACAWAWRKRLLRVFRGRWPLALAGAGLFSAVSAPMVGGWIERRAELAEFALIHIGQPGAASSNGDIIGHFVVRARQLETIFAMPGVAHLLGGEMRFPLWPSALTGASAAAGLWLAGLGRNPRARSLWLFGAVYFLFSLFTPTGLWLWHLFPLLGLCCAAAASPSALAPRRWRGAWAAAIGALILTWSLWTRATAARLQEALARGGSLDQTIYGAGLEGLCGWIQRYPSATFVPLDPAVGNVMRSCRPLDAPVEPVPIETASAAEIVRFWRRTLPRRDHYYVIDGNHQVPEVEVAFRLQAQRLGLRLDDIEAIRRPDGSPLVLLERTTPEIRP